MRLLNSPEPGFLNDEQRAQAAALFDALLPGSSDAPGATDAGAVDYLDSLLTRDPTSYYEIQGWRDLYTQALSALDEAARQANGRGGLAAWGARRSRPSSVSSSAVRPRASRTASTRSACSHDAQPLHRGLLRGPALARQPRRGDVALARLARAGGGVPSRAEQAEVGHGV